MPPSSPISKPVQYPDADVHVADRLATQNNLDQGAKPKSSEPPNGFSDHHTTPPGNEKSTPSLPASKPTPNRDVDVRLAEQGDVFAQYRLGRFYAQRDGRQTPEAVSWYKKASPGLHRLAETGNGQAMYILGVMYAYGRGVTRDTEHARHWLSRAVEQKVTAAQPVLTSLDKHRGPEPQSRMSEQAKSTGRKN
jgi:TPR repeat protein